MTRENSDEILSPSRRAMLKAAAAAGAFAVPLIASFSMDTASAQTRSDTFGSSNHPVIVSNMFCANMTVIPTAVFYARLQRVDVSTGNPAGPVVGLAGFEFVHGQNELFYELLLRGALSQFIVRGPYGRLFDETRKKVGAIPGQAITCGPGEMALPTVYSSFTSGDSVVEVDLANGTRLLGAIVGLDHNSGLQHSFRFVGQH
jgi:hypothetical protein